jgi:hypothetical protein
MDTILMKIENIFVVEVLKIKVVKKGMKGYVTFQ